MIREIKIKDIKPGENYRKHSDKAGMKELTASVKSHGVLQPIIVRKIGKQYEIIAGHRRHAAAESAGLKTIPASVVTADDAVALEIAVIENSQREDPNPMDEAVGFKRLLELGKHTPDTLAAKLGKSLSYVYARLKLNDMPKDCQKTLLSGQIELGIALQLCRLADKKDMSALLADVLDQDMSISQVRYHVQTEYGIRLDTVLFDKAGCDKCTNRTVTQASLFPGVDGDDDRCMDAKCWHGRTMERLVFIADDLNAKGFGIIRDPEEVRGLDRKGVKIHFQAPLKPKCKNCKERSFFYAEGSGQIIYGWHCPSKKCHNEVYYGIKPKEKTGNREACAEQSRSDAKGARENSHDDDITSPRTEGFGEGADSQSDKSVVVLQEEGGRKWVTCPECGCVSDVVEDEKP